MHYHKYLYRRYILNVYNKHYIKKSNSNFNKRCKIILAMSLFILLLGGTFFEAYQYNQLITDFKKNFSTYNFSAANNLLLTKQKFNIFKPFMLTHDISVYLDSELDNLSNDIGSNSINSSQALIKLKEINHYNLVDNDKLADIENSIASIKESNESYINGLVYFSNEQYNDAILSFKIVSPLDLNYANSLKYLDASKDKLKENILTRCDDLVNNDYYTQALATINENKDILGDDSSVEEKIAQIKVKQQEYLDKNSQAVEASSQALNTIISPTNINKLNIESNTSYLISVNLKEQKTYVFKGKLNKWELVKTFLCSTGIESEPTPTGSFTIKEKGEWFFSDKFKQGGKFWSQITGDILFHSLPFAQDKTTILDYTLKKPSSHGCIRLAVEDAKWIYTNIPKGSKVIIK